MSYTKVDVSDLNKHNFGLLIQTHRKAKGYSQDKLGELVGITRKSVSCIERGECYPSPENIFKIARVLDLSLDEYVYSYSRFDKTICIDEINNMLKSLDSDGRCMVIAALDAMCKTLLLRNQ